MKRILMLTILAANTASALAQDQTKREPISYRVEAGLPDAAEWLSPSAVRLEGYLGQRVLNNEKNRLLRVDLEPLLAGFRQKPGSHPWIGEHIGKWLHASTLAWAYTGDADLRAKMDYAVRELVRAQEPDGYLGTYVPEKRFGLFEGADWDVWSHKYNLIGLLTYYHYTGDPAALAAGRKIGDLLIRTFGPGKKSILSAGTHVGMAATSVLEPVVLLYRHTGDERYLEFARYLVRAWDDPAGPKIIASLLAGRGVNQTANGKAYEMLSNLVGLCELARAAGDKNLLTPVLDAWGDIVAHRLYLTGSASQGEHFRDDYYLPNQSGANVSETCVTTTWIQLNSQLLRLTAQARFGDELEKTLCNHLAAAQRPDGAQWCYFTALEGTKPYGPGINCCVSSGPRGMALAPLQAYLRLPPQGAEPEALVVNLFEASRVQTRLGGQDVTLEQRTDFPRSGAIALVIHTPQPATFGLRIRVPAWARPARFQIGGQDAGALTEGWQIIPARPWQDGDRVEATLSLAARRIDGNHGNAGRSALEWGPFVLAYDTHRNPDLPTPALLVFADEPGEPPFRLARAAGFPLRFEARVCSTRQSRPWRAIFVPFADAGGDGGRYEVWLRAPGVELPKNDSLFAFAQETRSQTGNVDGSICDGDRESFVVTFNNRPQREAWFAVSLETPVTFRQVVYAHGKTFHDGGWFDATAGKPRLEIQRRRGSPWEAVGALEDYPSSTSANPAGLKGGDQFRLRFDKPLQAVALRIIGRPAGGDNPAQAFASCAELQAFP